MAYTPATNLTSSAGLAHLQQLFYKKRGLDRLQKKFVFRDACMDDMLPKQNGRTVQWFRYTNFTADTTASTEGTVGTGLSLTSRIVQATISQYTNFITVSDLLRDTAPDPMVQGAAELLGYQGGLSVDTITRTIMDAATASTVVSMLGASFRVADLRNIKSILSANDVEPFEDGQFLVFMHPYISYDLVNDPSAGGLADIVKYTAPQSSPLVRYEDRGLLTSVAGCKVIESTNVRTQATPNRYTVYVFGKGGVGAVDLEGRGPNRVKDPKKQRFSINIIKGEPNIADPEGVIGAAVSYNFVYTAAILDGPATIGGVYRFRTIDATSTIA